MGSALQKQDRRVELCSNQIQRSRVPSAYAHPEKPEPPNDEVPEDRLKSLPSPKGADVWGRHSKETPGADVMGPCAGWEPKPGPIREVSTLNC